MNLRKYLTTDQPGPGDRALDERQERLFMERSASVLRFSYPNPTRNGCPDSSVLRQIAGNQLRLREAAPWMKHLGSCSECYRDFEKYKEAVRHRKNVTLAYSVAASVALAAIVVSLVFWNSHRRDLAHGGHREVSPNNVNGGTTARYVPFALDLRDAAQVRGPNGTKRPAIKLPRMPLHVSAYLPLGSDRGEYMVSLTRKGKPVWSGAAVAQMRDKRMVAELDVDLTPHPLGRYVLQLSSKAGTRLSQDIDLEEPEKRK